MNELRRRSADAAGAHNASALGGSRGALPCSCDSGDCIRLAGGDFSQCWPCCRAFSGYRRRYLCRGMSRFLPLPKTLNRPAMEPLPMVSGGVAIALPRGAVPPSPVLVDDTASETVPPPHEEPASAIQLSWPLLICGPVGRGHPGHRRCLAAGGTSRLFVVCHPRDRSSRRGKASLKMFDRR